MLQHSLLLLTRALLPGRLGQHILMLLSTPRAVGMLPGCPLQMFYFEPGPAAAACMSVCSINFPG